MTLAVDPVWLVGTATIVYAVLVGLVLKAGTTAKRAAREQRRAMERWRFEKLAHEAHNDPVDAELREIIDQHRPS